MRVPDQNPRPDGSSAERLGFWVRHETLKPALIAVASTVVVFGAGVWFVVSSPNWPAVKNQFFNPDDFAAAWPDVLDGFWRNLQMFAYSMLAIPVLALVIAVARSLRGPAFFPIRFLATAFTDVMRGIPLILLILLLGFGLPALQLPGLPKSAMFWGVTALTLSYSAYTAEIYRSGIDAVPESQRASARSLGLSQIQALRYAILPQAIRNVVPALMNTVVSLQKDVALVSVLGVRDAVREAQIYTSRTFNYTSYVAATVLFLLISIPLTRFVDWYAARDRARMSDQQR
ncbi:MAG: amino acid ABC transporter permease [Actinobacteria bacterium]|nr:amino acid ABC transporter permease [Actinomycetota bacterium]MCB9390131.1 amino acid ABC transporter permease [Acidimicrobiia bacterium]